MEYAAIVAKQVIIMFLLLAIGIFLRKKNIVSDEAAKSFANVLLTIVMPVMLIKAYMRPFDIKQVEGLLVSVVLAFVFHLIALAITPLLIKKRESQDFRVERIASIFSNCGFMAFPLLAATLGSDGVFYGAAFVGVFNIFTWTGGIMTLTGEKKLNIKKIFFNPGFIGFAIGLILYFTQIPVPYIVSETINHVAGLNTPLAMIITGIFLAGIDLKDTIKDNRVYISAFSRIILLPAIMLVIVLVSGIAGRFYQGDIVVISHIIACACPTAASAILLTSKMGKNSAHGAEIVAVSTLLSVFTLPLFAIVVNAAVK